MVSSIIARIIVDFKAFDNLEVIRQGEVVENKRLSEVLKLARL